MDPSGKINQEKQKRGGGEERQLLLYITVDTRSTGQLCTEKFKLSQYIFPFCLNN